MSDDELLDRWTELMRKISWTARYGSPQVLGALQTIKAQIEFEQRERRVLPMLQARAAQPSVIVETDPELSKAAKMEAEEEAAKRSPKNTQRPKPFTMTKDSMRPERIRPTKKPLDP